MYRRNRYDYDIARTYDINYINFIISKHPALSCPFLLLTILWWMGAGAAGRTGGGDTRMYGQTDGTRFYKMFKEEEKMQTSYYIIILDIGY